MKALFYSFLLISSSLLLKSQTNSQAFDWAFNTGGAGDNVKKMIYNSAGDLFVLGQARDTAAFGNVVIGAPKVGSFAGTVQYLGKKSANGTYSVLFSTFYVPSTGSSIIPVDFCMDANDNIYMMGTVSTLPPNVANFGNGLSVDSNCFFVAKLNPAGTPQWVKKFRLGTNFTAFIDPLNIALFPNGDVLFIAQSANSGPNGYQPVRFIRLDNNGNEIWQREYFFKNGFGSSLSYYADKTSNNGFVMDNLGNFYLKYRTINDQKIIVNTDTVSVPGSGTGAFSFFFAFNSNGLKRYYKGYRAVIGDVAVERNTGNILMSYTQQFANPAPFNSVPAISNNFAGLVIADSSFNFIKSSQSTISTSNLYINPVSIYPLGNFKALSTIKFCKNNTLAAGTQSYTNSSSTVFVWEETDQNCAPLYFVAEPNITGNCNTPNHAIAVNGNKAAVCGVWPAGTSITINTTTLTANDKNATPTSTPISSDAFITQFDRTLQASSVGVKETGNATTLVNVFPNPSNGTFTIQADEKLMNATATISNILGTTIFEHHMQSTELLINKELEAGVYFIKIEKENYSAIKKIIIQ